MLSRIFHLFSIFFLYPQSPESCTQLHLSSHGFLMFPASCPAWWKPLAAFSQPPSASLRPCSTSPWQETVDTAGENVGTSLEMMLENHWLIMVDHHFLHIFFRWHDHLLEIAPKFFWTTMFGVFARKVSVAVAFWWDSIVIADVSRLISLSQ